MDVETIAKAEEPMMEAELLPCPFCGESDVEAYRSPLSVVWHVYCTACEIHGHGEPSEADAIAAWNTRTKPTPVSGTDAVEVTRATRRIRRIRGSFENRIDEITTQAIEESLAEIERAFDVLVADRDEWRTQHENLLSVRQTDIQSLSTKEDAFNDGVKACKDKLKATGFNNVDEFFEELSYRGKQP